MEYVRRTYGVPARRGGRVRYTGSGVPLYGVIVGAKAGRLGIVLDCTKTARRPRGRVTSHHPTYELTYSVAGA